MIFDSLMISMYFMKSTKNIANTGQGVIYKHGKDTIRYHSMHKEVSTTFIHVRDLNSYEITSQNLHQKMRI